jgi:transcriptional regulator with XRE-family HTH domain
VNQIKRYETGTAQPSLEALKKIAVTLRVSTDSLLFREAELGPDEDLRLQFEAISRMPLALQQVAKEVLEGLIIKHEARRWSAA